jgi:hypothetical protein
MKASAIRFFGEEIRRLRYPPRTISKPGAGGRPRGGTSLYFDDPDDNVVALATQGPSSNY